MPPRMFSQGRWQLSNEALYHICSNIKLFSDKLEPVSPEKSMYQGYQVKGIGSMSMFAEAADGSCQQIEMKNVRYIPGYKTKEDKSIHNVVVARGQLGIFMRDADIGKCIAEFEDDSGKRVHCLAWENDGAITLQSCTSDGCKGTGGHQG